MHKLIPHAVHQFKTLNLTQAGKIRLSPFSNHALIYARDHCTNKTNTQEAFDEIFALATENTRTTYRHLNTDALAFLTVLYGIKEDDPSVAPKTSRLYPDYQHKNSPSYEDIYVSYFKLKDHLSNNNLNFSNPYEGRYQGYLQDAIESTGADITQLEEELYAMYLKRKETGDIYADRKTNTIKKTRLLNPERTTRVRPTERHQRSITY